MVNLNGSVLDLADCTEFRQTAPCTTRGGRAATVWRNSVQSARSRTEPFRLNMVCPSRM